MWLALGFGIGTGIALSRGDSGLLVFSCLFIALGSLALLMLGWDDFSRRGLSFRPEIWSEFVDRSITSHPFLGAGSGSSTYWPNPDLDIRHPHSVFVSIFFFGGVVGLGLFLGLLGACIQQLRQPLSGEVKVLGGMLLSFGIVFSIFDGDNILTKIDYLWWLIWMPIGLCLSLER